MTLLDTSQENEKRHCRSKCDLSASAMRNTGKPRKEGTQIKAEVTHPVNRQNCSGDTNHEEAFNPTRWFLIYLHRKGYGYCRCDNRRFADKGDFIWQKL